MNHNIGFVFSNLFLNPQQCRGLNSIGFVWLCFFAAQNYKIIHNLLSNKTLRRFALSKIGFVFSNDY